MAVLDHVLSASTNVGDRKVNGGRLVGTEDGFQDIPVLGGDDWVDVRRSKWFDVAVEIVVSHTLEPFSDESSRSALTDSGRADEKERSRHRQIIPRPVAADEEAL